MTPYSDVVAKQRFGVTFCLHPQSEDIDKKIATYKSFSQCGLL